MDDDTVDDDTVECEDCGKCTTASRAVVRRLNQGRCGYCGGKLKVLIRIRVNG